MIGDELLTGVCDYSDFYPGRKEPLARIYVPFRPHGAGIRFVGLVDTGGHFCILGPEVVDLIGDSLSGGEATSLLTAQGRLSGRLYRHRIELLAEEGENLDLEATVLVSPDWRGPSVLGYTGFLDRMRFAIDPRANQFYFGSLG
jgi:hypothetical protein